MISLHVFHTSVVEWPIEINKYLYAKTFQTFTFFRNHSTLNYYTCFPRNVLCSWILNLVEIKCLYFSKYLKLLYLSEVLHLSLHWCVSPSPFSTPQSPTSTQDAELPVQEPVSPVFRCSFSFILVTGSVAFWVNLSFLFNRYSLQ